jgi:transposase
VPKPKSKSRAAVGCVEVADPADKRRRFSPAEKLRIVRAASECVERGSIEALMRREGIYSSMLSNWRRVIDTQGVEGLQNRKPGRKPKRDVTDRRIEELEKRLAHIEQELSVTRAMVDLQGTPQKRWA